MFLVSGVAADLDYLSYLAGPGAFLKLHGALLHSLVGSVVLVCVIAAGFFAWDRRGSKDVSVAPASVAWRWKPAIVVCAFGVAWHLALDFCSGDSVQLLWPFKVDSAAWSYAANLDPLILILLAAGLLLPLLFRLVSEEIGERKKRFVGQKGALATLVLLVLYLGARGMLHGRAVDLLMSRTFHGRTPLSAGAFPSATSPFTWRGVVTTDNTIEDIEVSLAAGAEFDADRSTTRYKPDDSRALDTGQRTAITKQFLRYTQIPLASMYRREEVFRFEVHDARFPAGDTSRENIFLRIDMNSDLSIREQGFMSAASPNN